jgi:hypothetical protein
MPWDRDPAAESAAALASALSIHTCIAARPSSGSASSSASAAATLPSASAASARDRTASGVSPSCGVSERACVWVRKNAMTRFTGSPSVEATRDSLSAARAASG